MTFVGSSTAAMGASIIGRPEARSIHSDGQHPARVLAVAVHPGDCFFSMGAPVALAVQQHGMGQFLSLSLGSRGSASVPPDVYGAMQKSASERGSEILGAEKPVLMAYEDGEVPSNDEIRFAVCDVIRKFMPTVVITHWKGSWHKDHRACHEIVNDAIFYAGLPAIKRDNPAHTVKKVFYAWNWEDAGGFTADVYLDISPVFEQWKAACACFPMWRGENGFRYDNYYQSNAVETGCICGAPYGVALMSPREQLVQYLKWL